VTFYKIVEVDASCMVRLVRQTPNQSCVLDPALTWLVKQFVLEFSPFLAVLFNEWVDCRTSRLWLDASKTELIWLGEAQ